MYKKIIEEIKFKMNLGVISYYQAKSEAEPIIEEMNKRGLEIAKKYKQRFKPFTFAGLMR